jgi:TatD DNase family protein
MRAARLGIYISFSGVVTFKKSDELRAIARDLPLTRILVETDAPYLAPEPYRGNQNEPALVVHTAAAIAKARAMPADDLAEATTENFFRLFSKVPRNAHPGRARASIGG